MAEKRNSGQKKGRSKKVIDYDPLAWLDDAPGDGPDEPAAEPEVAPSEAPQAGDRAPEATAGSERVEPPVETDPGYGFFDDEAAPAENETEDAAAGEGPGFGFFDDAPASEAATERADDEAAGYGFFEDSPTPERPSAAADDDEGAYGFFDEASPAGSAREPWKDDDSVIHLGAELGIRSVQQAHGLIAESLAQGFDPRLDAGDLQKIDSAGLQMIYSLRMSVEKTGQPIIWTRSSPLIDRRAAELGLPPLTGDADGTSDDGDAGFGFF